MPNPKPKVFVSYSADERQFVEGLEHELQDTYEVVWDRDGRTLLPGTEWRTALYREFARCQAAIVVISQGALNSAYVPLEAMVLAWRQLLDPAFVVIPVFFAPFSEKTLHAPDSRFCGVGLEHLQGMKVDHQPGAEPNTHTKIKQALGRIARCIPLGTLHVAHRLAGILSKIENEASLRVAAEAAGVQYDEWDPALPRQFLLALSVLKCDIPQAASALSNLACDLSPVDRRTLYDMITPLWVSLPAATALRRESARLAVINSTYPETPNDYIKRAWSDQPKEVKILPITSADDGTGTEIESAVAGRLHHAILTQFPKLTARFGGISNVVPVLNGLRAMGQPLSIFISSSSGVKIDAVVSLQKKWQPTRIVYIDKDARAATLSADACLIDPDLDLEMEENANQQCAAAGMALLPEEEEST